MAWMLVNKCRCNLVPPSSIRTLLPTSLCPKDAPFQFMVTEIACWELLVSPYLVMKMPTQVSGRKCPLSYTDMFLHRVEQVVMLFSE